MEIATADDANESIYVRQYSGVFGTLNTTLTLLDASHNTIIPNALTVGTTTSQAANYKFYVNGSSYFNGNTTHNGMDYFANGTTYYINNSADANLRRGIFSGTSNGDTAASSFFNTGALEIREAGRVGNGQTSFNYAPRIGFHWSGRIAGSLSFHNDGIFYFRKQNGTDRATIDANVNGNSSTATQFASNKSITLTGDVSGSASSKGGWSITTSIGAGKVTNAMLAGSIENGKLINSKITLAGNDVSLGGSLSADTLRTSLGLSNALHFIGIATVAITDGSTTDPKISGYITKTSGDVIIDKDSAYEYIWTGSKWERLGGDGSYKVVQSVISSPSTNGTEISFIDTISQNANGVITATKKTVRDASASQSGVVNTGAQTFAGIKTFTDPVRIGSDPNGRGKNYIAFYGTTGDNAGNFNHAYIGENLWGSSESSELVLFKGNDIGTDATTVSASGPDRIRHIAGAHLFQTYGSALSGTFSDICTSTVPTNIFAINNTNTKHYVDALPATNNTRTLGSSSLRWKALLIGTANSYGSATVPVYWNNGVPTAITSYSGNAATATKWQTARNFITNLGSETAASVDGSTGPYNLGVTGTLPVTHGGTGVTSIAEIKAGKDSDGNTIKDTYLKRYRNSNTYGSGYTDLNGTMPPFLQAYKNGYPLHTDPEFASGNNDIALYDNAGSGKTTIERIDMACGNSTGKVLRIRNIGSGPSPYLGGWYFADATAYARQYVCIFRAKVPIGYTINWHSNPYGTNGTTYWVTEHVGTGKWEWYAYFVDNGSANFSSTMFFALSGTPGTTNAPVDWFLSYANTIILSYGAYDGLRTRYADNADR